MEWQHSSPREGALARIGSAVGDGWHLEALLSHDGCSSVYRATRREATDTIGPGRAEHARAIVTVIEADLDDSPLGQRLVRAQYTGNRIGHPGVPSVFEEGSTADGLRYLVSEHLEGECVEYLSRRGRREEAFVLTLLDEVLGVLIAAHARGIVHGGIQPSQIYLTTEGTVRVLGYESAGLRDGSDAMYDSARPDAALGTPAFQPPEQALGRWTEVDATSDLWSLAATAATVLLGRRLRNGETASDDLFAAMTEPLPPISSLMPSVSHDLARILDRALAFHREARFPHAMAMRSAVQSALSKRSATTEDAPDTLRLPTFPISAPQPKRESAILSTTLTPHVWPTGDHLRHDESTPSPLAQSERPWTPAKRMMRTAVAASLGEPKRSRSFGPVLIGTALGVALGLGMVFVVGPKAATKPRTTSALSTPTEAPPLRSPTLWQSPLRTSPLLPVPPPLPLAFRPQPMPAEPSLDRTDAGAPQPKTPAHKAIH
jgi:serine/threonine protein kinase